jgi:hypothetical protein
MIIRCLSCHKYFDDEFRDTGCPHSTFLANNGTNKFQHYPESWLASEAPVPGTAEYREYKEWLDKNKVRIR